MREKYTSAILFSAFFTALLLWKSDVQAGVAEGLSICCRVLIPSLFCFSVGVNYLLRIGVFDRTGSGLEMLTNKLLHLHGPALLPVLAGLLGGFPLGPCVLAQMYEDGAVSRQDAYAVSGICNQAGPAFLLGAVGSITGSSRTALLLFLINLVSAGLTALLLRPERQPMGSVRKKRRTPQKASLAFLDSVRESTFAMLQLTGFVVFFTAGQHLLCRLLPLDRFSSPVTGLLLGMFELSTGTVRFMTCAPGSAFLPLSFLIGWGGLCVHLQAASFFLRAGIPMKQYLLGKTVQGLLCAALASILHPLLFSDQQCIFDVVVCLISILAIIFLLLRKKNSGKNRNLCYNRTKHTA